MGILQLVFNVFQVMRSEILCAQAICKLLQFVQKESFSEYINNSNKHYQINIHVIIQVIRQKSST